MKSKNISLFCWNIGNPSLERAIRQGEWLRGRKEDILILSEAKKSKGCDHLENYFKANGYHVLFPRLEGKKYGAMILSKYPLIESSFSDYVNFLPERVAAVKVLMSIGIVEIIGIYVPSRDASPEKIKRKKNFLKSMRKALREAPQSAHRIFCGDFNVLEPGHFPHYSFFKEWEYDFYDDLAENNLKDVFRYINPHEKEYSWVGRTGDGYRYDHLFASESMLSMVGDCSYYHEPRSLRMSDHSAIIAAFQFN